MNAHLIKTQLMHFIDLLPPGAASLLSLVDLQTVATRAALTGTSFLLECLVICPGLHKQQNASELNKSEYPACAAMTTGYVFRVENEATVFQLQRLGRPGHLTTLRVSSERRGDTWKSFDMRVSTNAGLVLNIATALVLGAEDYRALTALVILILIGIVNVLIFHSRSKIGWKGAAEPGVEGDLLVLLSQDRWIRIRGLVDDIKAVTSGQWLRDMTPLERSLVSFGTLLLYFNAALMWEVSKLGQALLMVLLLGTTMWLGYENQSTRIYRMYGRSIYAEGPPRAYKRRLDLAEQLIKETGRDDWAIRLGMIQPKSSDQKEESKLGPKIM